MKTISIRNNTYNADHIIGLEAKTLHVSCLNEFYPEIIVLTTNGERLVNLEKSFNKEQDALIFAKFVIQNTLK